MVAPFLRVGKRIGGGERAGKQTRIQELDLAEVHLWSGTIE